MTVPSTEELQQLLDAATPGEWQFRDNEEWEHVAGPEYPPQRVMLEHAVEVDGVPLFWSYNDELLEDYPGNLRIAALSRDLAAEVIRLREGIADAKSRLDCYVDAYHKQGQFYTSARLRDHPDLPTGASTTTRQPRTVTTVKDRFP